MSGCPEREQILELLAGGVSTDTACRDHLTECADCRRYAAQLGGTIRWAAALEAFLAGTGAAVPAEVARRVFARLEPIYGELTDRPADCPPEDVLIAAALVTGAVTDAHQRHIDTCARCQWITRRLKAMRRFVVDYKQFASDSRQEEVPPDVASRIFERVNRVYDEQVLESQATVTAQAAVDAPSTAAALWPRTRTFLRAALPYASAACLLIATGMFLLAGIRDNTRRQTAMNVPGHAWSEQQRVESSDVPLANIRPLGPLAKDVAASFLAGYRAFVTNRVRSEVLDQLEEMKKLASSGDLLHARQVLQAVKSRVGDEAQGIVDRAMASLDRAWLRQLLEREDLRRLEKALAQVDMPKDRKTEIQGMVRVLRAAERARSEPTMDRWDNLKRRVVAMDRATSVIPPEVTGAIERIVERQKIASHQTAVADMRTATRKLQQLRRSLITLADALVARASDQPVWKHLVGNGAFQWPVARRVTRGAEERRKAAREGNRSRGGRYSKGTQRGQAHFSELPFGKRRAPIGRKMSQTPRRERFHRPLARDMGVNTVTA